MLRKESVDGLAGANLQNPRYVPIDYLQIKKSVESFEEALTSLRWCDKMCTLTAVQGQFVKNISFLKVAVIQHTFVHVLPVPKSPDSKDYKSCVWNKPVTYGRQLDVLILCQRIMEHFVASVLSLKNNRPLDAVRIIIPGCITAIADAMMRKVATDDPSELCLYLMGERGGTQYGLSTGMLGPQTETIEVHTPELNIARTAVLDYFKYQADRKFVQIMKWEDTHTNKWGYELNWLAALGKEWAFPQPGHPKYLCGGLITKNWPELVCYRDVAFYFKWFLNTDPQCFPRDGVEYVQSQAQLQWGINPKGFTVITSLVPPRFPMFCRPRPGIPFGHRFETFADPSKLTGHTVNTEDDVLHIRNLPGFEVQESRTFKDENGVLKEVKVNRVVIGQKDSELLMSYLTVPYMRVPLVISFFATEDRIHSLRSPKLRNLLDSVMFEPGVYLPLNMTYEPKFVPAKNEALLATPYGLLINEIHRSPDAVLQSVIKLLELAMDLDTGSFKSSTVDIILYVIRLCCRVDNYIDFMIQLENKTHECIRTPLRDVKVTEKTLIKLEAYQKQLRKLLRHRVHDMVEGYIVEAMNEANARENDEVVDKNTKVACRMHTHLILIYRNVPMQDLTLEIASTLLCSMIFLTIRHTWNLNLLEIPEFEIYELLQVMRRRLIKYTRSLEQQDLNELMEAAVRVSTGTGLRKSFRLKKKSRNWAYIRGKRSVGRFTVLTARSRFYQLAETKVKAVDDTGDLGVEIDWQTIQLTLRTSHLKALDNVIARNPDVVEIFGTKSMQAATIQNAENRQWVRLVGRQHDIEFWRTPDTVEGKPRLAEQELMREYNPTELEDTERWIVPIWEPVRRKFFVPPPPNPPIPIWIAEEPLDKDAEVVYMTASHPKLGGTIKEIYVFKTLQIVQVYDVFSYGRRFYRSLVYSSDARYSLRDIQPTTKDRRAMWVSWGRHEAGFPWAGDRAQGVSCVISRHRDYADNLTGTKETFIPDRLLYGIVPHCLFETHRFWQDENDNIHGYPKLDESGPIICVQWKKPRKVGAFEITGGITARITRVPKKLFKRRMKKKEMQDLKDSKIDVIPLTKQDSTASHSSVDVKVGDMFSTPTDKKKSDREKSVDEVELTLVNMLYAPPKSKVYNMFQTLKRVEKLSFTLCWTRETNPEGGEFDLDLVEMPRLKMSFVGRKVGRKTRLFSVDHADLFISNERSMMACSLLRGIPHSLLMQNQNGEMKILVPCIHPVRPNIQSAPFSTELVMNYANRAWLEVLSQRYFLYPVHISLSFLFTPTLNSALYLLLLRFLHRDYAAAFRLVNSIGTDAVFLDEEAMVFMDLKQCNGDRHPDAHAVRLAISHVMIDSEGALTSPNQQFMDILRLKTGEVFECDVTGKKFKQEGTIYFRCFAPNGPLGFTACQRVMEGKVPLPWDLTNEMSAFITKIDHVSSTCRISNEHQLEILDKCIVDTSDQRFNPRKYTVYGIILNKNRKSYLEATLTGQEKARCWIMPRIPESKWPLRVNRTALGNTSMSNDGIVSLAVRFNTSPAVGGHMALSAAQKFLTPAGMPPQYENTKGQLYSHGFLFLYGLYTGTIKCKIGSNDDSRCLALLLTQLLHDRNEEWNPMISILDIIGKNPHIIPSLPKFRDTRRNKHPRITVLAQGDEKTSPLSDLLEKLFKQLPAMERDQKLEFPDGEYDEREEEDEECDVIQPSGRKFILPELSDLQCNKLSLNPLDGKKLGDAELDISLKDMMEFTVQPMRRFIDAKWNADGELVLPDGEDEDDTRPIVKEFKKSETQGASVANPILPFDVSAHPQAASEVARLMLARFAKDVKIYANIHNSKKKTYLDGLFQEDVTEILSDPRGEATDRAIEQMTALMEEMEAQRDTDAQFVDISLSYVQRVANYVQAPDEKATGKCLQYETFLLNRICNQETKIWMEYLIGSLLSTQTVMDLQKLNPYFTNERIKDVKEVLTATILKANRVGQLNRAVDCIRKVIKILTKLQNREEKGAVTSASEKAALVLSAEKIIGNLCCKRYYMDESDPETKKVCFDPRYLVFEFVWNIILRKKQVIHVREYLQAMKENRSIVKQLIMGSGKTMVISPLLCLMLSDGKTLVTLSVPPALLELTRSNLRNTFSSIMSKRIYTLKFDRASLVQPRLLRKLTIATEKAGIIISNPTSIKSLMLKFIEILDIMTDPAAMKNDRIDYERDRNLVVDCLKKFQNSILIMDEVDLILHPLKSELNFPTGPKVKLDFSPMRWELPIHIVDAIFYSTLSRMSVAFQDSMKAQTILKGLNKVLEEGYEERALQKIPHVVLLNADFYHEKMKPLLAKWVMLWMETKHFKGLSDEDLEFYLLHGAVVDEKRVDEMKSRLKILEEVLEAKTLTASQMEILKVKTDILTSERRTIVKAKVAKLKIEIPKLITINGKRGKLAPVVDAIAVPEFRKMLNLARDYLKMYMPHILQKINRVSFGIMTSQDKMRALAENPYMPRTRYMLAIPFVGKDVPSRASEFAHPDVVIGLTILAYRYSGLRWDDFDHIVASMRNKLYKDSKGPVRHRPMNRLHEQWVKIAKGFIKGSKEEKKLRKEGKIPAKALDQITVVALRLLQRSNSEQMNKLFDLWKDLPETIHYYLNDYVFDKYMRHQQVKLSACGQELGGAMLFPRRIGFSGTPSDLMPVELGQCDYEEGADGSMFYSLTSTTICSHQLIDEKWSVDSLLDLICKGTWSALIDVGALVTGKTNYEVAKYLLDNGLPWCEGVVFLDEADRKMILVRATGRVLKLSQCGIAKEKRFAFYDQVHTTGMDIKHKLDACAVLTIGKDMTWRDYAQAAFRMRGISKGQKIHLFLIPEIYRHMKRELLKAAIVVPEEPSPKQILNYVAAWLVVNSMRMERIQFNMLQMQNVANIWRKRGFNGLLEEHNTFKVDKKQPNVYLRKCLNMFREPLDFSVEASVPKPRVFSETIEKLINQHKTFVMGEDESLTKKVLELVSKADKMLDLSFVALEAEQQQEAEQEQESTKEQEQEQEQEEEIEIEKFVDVAYQRDNEAPIPWEFARLRDKGFCPQFYDASDFKLYKGKPVKFPGYILVSDNYFNRQWGGDRRIKNVVMTLEWVPNPQEVKQYPPRESKIPQSWDTAFQTAFNMFDQDNSGTLEPSEVSELVRAATDVRPSEAELADLIKEFGKDGKLSRSGLLDTLQSGNLRPEFKGRYTIALSLAEAETIRRIMHIRLEKKIIDGADVSIALRCSEAKNMIFDQSLDFSQSSRYQREASWQSLRYLNCDMYYQDPQLNVLVRAMQFTPVRERVVFFINILGCRRRAAYRWASTPLSKLFRTESEFHMLKNRSQAIRVREAVKAKNLLPWDTFRSFNSRSTGYLSPPEVWAGLEFLGLLNLTPKDVFDFVKTADKNSDGNIDYAEWLDVLRDPDEKNEEDDDEEDEKKYKPDGEIEKIPPKGAKELEEYQDNELKEEGKHQEREIEEAKIEAKRRRIEIESEEEIKEIGKGNYSPNPEITENYVAWDFTTPRKPVGVAKINHSHVHMRRAGQNYLRIYPNGALSLTTQKSMEAKDSITLSGNCGGKRLNQFTIVLEMKMQVYTYKPEQVPEGKKKPEKKIRAILNLDRFNHTKAAVGIDKFGVVGIGQKYPTVEDARVRMTNKKWSFLTVVGDAKAGTMKTFIDGVLCNELKKSESKDVEFGVDSESFSVSPDIFFIGASPDSKDMESQVELKRVWLYNDAKADTMIPLMNDEFTTRDPWRGRNNATISPADAKGVKTVKSNGDVNTSKYASQIAQIKAMLGSNAPSDAVLALQLDEAGGDIQRVLTAMNVLV